MTVPKDKNKRRAGGAIRVPFVRRCQIEFADQSSASAFIANINVLGIYLAHDVMPPLGREVVCQFQVPGREGQVRIEGVVAWTNPGQEHPVHSLPPGFGVAFRDLSEEARARIEEVVFDYLARQKD
ncbi:MAG: PilZ domain-containing protein [Vicinamibacteria bacterium]